MSDDDKQPQGPFNPFIRFKNHVNSRIGTGVSVLTGGANDDSNKQPAGDTQHGGPVQATGWSSPCTGGNQSPAGPKRQSPIVEYWDDWCHVDPYSPHNLRHLPQPTPNDLPPGADPADFGYPEAFEDLLSASNPFRGHLMDLGMRAGLKRTASGGPVKPETPSAWVRRLYGDALLPHPLIWEQPRLAGGFSRHWEAHAPGPARPHHTPEQDHDPTSDIAKEFLNTIRRIDNIVGESFSKIEELMGQDVADMMRRAQKFAENAMKVFSEERSDNHKPSSSSHTKPQGLANSASVSEEDQPATELDLFEFIQSASAKADKFLEEFLTSRTGHASQPPERASRDNPPVSETVEHDPSGGKTIRTSSEHVDMFGFIHSRTEVRRLDAKGETIDYDTRYSVRSGPRGDRAPQQEYRPPSDAPISVPMMPEQYRAFIGKSSDEQLEAFRVATAEADESGLDPENLKLKNQQMQLIQQEQQARANSKAQPISHSLQDYQHQLMLLEQQNKQRLIIKAKQEAEAKARSHPEKPQGGTDSERSSGWFWR
ncbi:hypothetical protein DHEL01_v204433 [Diaporthe helianthi]|uniref:PI-PLC Y-box domain-containing protein n=1 Tax=Diaporthe helianthi TaxID=158607 RepID=A0A2P5I3V1_DIAHE|nr:hypothetical protein DHEL01_v204433 [Diaporthe helianthi]